MSTRKPVILGIRACTWVWIIMLMLSLLTYLASRLRFDLDLPSQSCDDQCIGEGILLPEWDYRSQRLQPEHCRMQPMVATDSQPCELPARLRRIATRLRAQFQALAPGPRLAPGSTGWIGDRSGSLFALQW